METLKSIVKELKTYNLVKNRKKLLEDKLEQYEEKRKPEEETMPWKNGSLYDMKMESILDGIDECDSIIDKVDGWLKDLEPLEKLIIEQRFFIGMSWIDVKDQAGYSDRTVRKIYSKGLDKIAERLGGSYEN